VWLALPICSLLSQASAAAAMFALYGTKGGKELFKLALGACICLQIGTETLLLVSADQSEILLGKLIKSLIKYLIKSYVYYEK
jgi:hypothetical protein